MVLKNVKKTKISVVVGLFGGPDFAPNVYEHYNKHYLCLPIRAQDWRHMINAENQKRTLISMLLQYSCLFHSFYSLFTFIFPISRAYKNNYSNTLYYVYYCMNLHDCQITINRFIFWFYYIIFPLLKDHDIYAMTFIHFLKSLYSGTK